MREMQLTVMYGGVEELEPDLHAWVFRGKYLILCGPPYNPPYKASI
jgi:hypothetical protein